MSEIIKDVHPANTNIYPCKNEKMSGTYRFCFDATNFKTENGIGIAIFDRKSEKLLTKIPFTNEYKRGNSYCLNIDDYDNKKYCYSYYCGDSFVEDKRADKYLNNNSYFGLSHSNGIIKSVFSEEYDWEDEKSPNLSIKDYFIYLMHVRGFTKHVSSGTSYKGTFKGIIDKIDYLKKLGVTTIELQPSYEFNEYDLKTDKKNYWGYCEANYYAPKASFSYSNDSDIEFCDLVKALHKNNMEIIMQMYFPVQFSRREITYILEYWVNKYHVDGFHVLGVSLPVNNFDDSPILANTKIMVDCLEGANLPENSYSNSKIKYALYRDEYMYAIRRFIKGDDNSIEDTLYRMRTNPNNYGVVNFLDNYNTFTLMDMVSYDRKHNEDNGEDNQDGSDYNCSWNCGVEGPTRKKKTSKLRFKQMQNALTILFFSAGIPMIFMGDEMCNSQNGNNNPYCHDSSITWLDWKGLNRKDSLYPFISMLARARKDFAFLKESKELSMIDMEGSGYPDLSYHGESPWKTQIEGYRHNVGIMFKAGKQFAYLALNMYWNDEVFALPRAPKGLKWSFVFATEEGIIEPSEDKVKIPERTVALFATKEI